MEEIIKISALDSKFIKSASNILESIPPLHTEIAILGRSNVGKSSLINKILNKKLAKSSSTPGKTKLINFFETTLQIKQNSEIRKLPFALIDLPGFGYAKVDKAQKRQWDKALSDFLKNRTSIKLFCHLIDSRHRDLEIDSNIREFLLHIKSNDTNILEIYTKSDKLKQNELRNIESNGKLTISSLKHNEIKLQKVYQAMINNALGLDNIESIFC